jgi:hypothetical protein
LSRAGATSAAGRRPLDEIEYYDIVSIVASVDHAAHLRLALDLLAESPSTEAATERIAAILREKAAAAGHPEKYHHTLTVFWMRMVAQLLDKDLPLAYYSANRLAGDAARTGWIEPDRRPL